MANGIVHIWSTEVCHSDVWDLKTIYNHSPAARRLRILLHFCELNWFAYIFVKFLETKTNAISTNFDEQKPEAYLVFIFFMLVFLFSLNPFIETKIAGMHFKHQNFAFTTHQ